MTFQQKLDRTIKKNNSLVCVGLDTDKGVISKSQFDFNKNIIDKTFDIVCCYKANIAFYSSAGFEGLKQLKKTIDYIHKKYDLPVILDAKRADIGNTSEQYAKEVFDFLGADAITVNPYLGFDSLEPFLKYKDKGIIILCRTSNPGASDFQDLALHLKGVNVKVPLYLAVAKKVVEWNKRYGNCLMVVGATWPEELKAVRKIAPTMTFLVPGIGPQGGDLEDSLKYGLTKTKSGLIIHSARAIIYAKDPRSQAQKLRNETNKFR